MQQRCYISSWVLVFCFSAGIVLPAISIIMMVNAKANTNVDEGIFGGIFFVLGLILFFSFFKYMCIDKKEDGTTVFQTGNKPAMQNTTTPLGV